jgi:hypothetical protein
MVACNWTESSQPKLRSMLSFEIVKQINHKNCHINYDHQWGGHYHIAYTLRWFTDDDDVTEESCATSSRPTALLVCWKFSLRMICVCIRRWIRIKNNDKCSLCINYIVHTTFFCSLLLHNKCVACVRRCDWLFLSFSTVSLLFTCRKWIILSWYFPYRDFLQ